MVAKINIGSSLYGALIYNNEKIQAQQASVLVGNKMSVPPNSEFNFDICKRDFDMNFPSESRTKKPVIHISLNPHPDDKLSDGQLSEIAQEYMERLGYGEQPYIVFKHEDIERAHLHILSLRVDGSGRKINDKFEYKRSKDITRLIEQKYNLGRAERREDNEIYRPSKCNYQQGDIKKQITNIIKPLAMQYGFLSLTEYKAMLSLYNVTVKEIKGEARGKAFDGLVYFATDDKGDVKSNPLKSSLFGKQVGQVALLAHFEESKQRLKQSDIREKSKGIILLEMKKEVTKEEFIQKLSERGIDVLFRENDDERIYGVTFIDHNSKFVLNGSRLGKEFSANVFHELFSNNASTPEMEQITQSVDITTLDDTPKQFDAQSLESDDFAPSDSHIEEVYKQESYETEGNSLGGIFSFNHHGDDPAEEAFARRMKRKKKQTKTIKR